ncbi:threonine/serine dehydratase [Vogesella sp. LIG4]|uniref:threonine/serine dehydratase n=1 Tax=Vogesella sp. LIG4 TaxID=1192162 RepID=UPI00081FF4C7|nr:threonine/serine dehydratase [Vogesella sp. LIG4]SCK30197.1 threonine dehydratase [Vogesella sp. LIG4]
MTALYNAIVDAHRQLRPQVRYTALDYSPALSQLTGCEVYLKAEHQQHTGSFKYRGASNKIRLLPPAARQAGVITASSGNHGQAVALAGRAVGVPVTVYAGEHAASVKLDAIRKLGVHVELVAGDALAAELAARAAAEQQGLTYISPYNDPQVIAGQGTVGVELAEQCPDLAAVCVAVGGGGLVSGIGTALRQLLPQADIVGCWPLNAPAMYRCLQAGEICDVAEQDTLSDGTAGGVEPGAVTFELCRQLIDLRTLVSEGDIRHAMRLLAEHEHWIVEGAAGVALAGLLQLAPHYRGRKVAVVLCGRNIKLQDFLAAIQAGESQ